MTDELDVAVDTHADTPQRLLLEGVDLRARLPDGHWDLPRAREGGLGAQFFSIFVPPEVHTGYMKYALALIEAVYRQAERAPEEMVVVDSVAGVRAARQGPKPKLAALLGVEGAHAFEGELAMLGLFRRLGVRYVTVTWNNTNAWADAVGDLDDPKVTHHGGLSEAGRAAIAEMQRLGIMVDVSHVSDKTFADILAITRGPVIASHSSARALTPFRRNLTDEMIRAVAKTGGVVMVTYGSLFVSTDFLRAYSAQKPEADKAIKAATSRIGDGWNAAIAKVYDRVSNAWARKLPRPPLSALIDHIDHVAKVGGIDHVGLGSDFDGVNSLPEGLDSVADLPKLREGLAARGYDATALTKIFGANLWRVMRRCEELAER